MKEEWMNLIGYEGLYRISNHGEMVSLAKNKKMKFFIKRASIPYYLVTLFKDMKYRTFRVHRLIAQHFIPNPLGLPVVNHKNKNTLDYSINNLEWVTTRENMTHAFLGKKNKTSKYPGVSYNKPKKKWIVYTYLNGKNKFLGLFSDEEKASLAYQNALNERGIVNKYATV